MRVLIVGASSGVGRELGRQLADGGHTVAFAARRRELVEAAAQEHGGVALVCDVRDEASCGAVVRDAVAGLGGLDALVYSTAIDVLVKLAGAGAATWRDTFETNVFGAALITNAALPHLRASNGRAVYISASSIDRPLPGMGVYAASKYALETMVRGYQAEHPDIGFANVRIGSAMPTGVYESWDRDLMVEMSQTWQALGYVHDNGPGGPMTVEQAAGAVAAAVTSPVWFRDLTAVSWPTRER